MSTWSMAGLSLSAALTAGALVGQCLPPRQAGRPAGFILSTLLRGRGALERRRGVGVCPALNFATWQALGTGRRASRRLPHGALAASSAIARATLEHVGAGNWIEAGGRRFRLVGEVVHGGLRIDGGRVDSPSGRCVGDRYCLGIGCSGRRGAPRRRTGRGAGEPRALPRRHAQGSDAVDRQGVGAPGCRPFGRGRGRSAVDTRADRLGPAGSAAGRMDTSLGGFARRSALGDGMGGS
jgi:hypothetical protein